MLHEPQLRRSGLHSGLQSIKHNNYDTGLGKGTELFHYSL